VFRSLSNSWIKNLYVQSYRSKQYATIGCSFVTAHMHEPKNFKTLHVLFLVTLNDIDQLQRGGCNLNSIILNLKGKNSAPNHFGSSQVCVYTHIHI